MKRKGISTNDPNWQAAFQALPLLKRKEFHQTFSAAFLDYLDQGWGECVLREQRLAQIVADSLLHFDGDRYQMGDFVIMPNHVHLLACLKHQTDIVRQCFSWKKFTAGRINASLGRTGRFWQEDSFDHLVRSPEQFAAIQRYIADNPAQLPQGDYLLRQLR